MTHNNDAGCGLHAWSSNTLVFHATSATVEGPYTFSDVALPVLATSPGPARAPDGTFLLFSMGDRNDTLAEACPGGKPEHTVHTTFFNVRLHSSKSPYGPWQPVLNASGGTVLWRAVNPTPTPWVLPNGTLTSMTHSLRFYMANSRILMGCPPPLRGVGSATISVPLDSIASDLMYADVQLAHSMTHHIPSGTVVVVGGGTFIAPHWSGPYTKVRGPPITPQANCSADPRSHPASSPAEHCAGEDPFLWLDPRDERWRWMEHQKLDDAPAPRNASDPTGHTPQCEFFPYTVGYAVSQTADLWGGWDYDFYRPGTGLNVAMATSPQTSAYYYCLGKRERPKIFLHGNRTWLLNGAAPTVMGEGDTGTFTMIQEVLAMA